MTDMRTKPFTVHELIEALTRQAQTFGDGRPVKMSNGIGADVPIFKVATSGGAVRIYGWPADDQPLVGPEDRLPAMDEPPSPTTLGQMRSDTPHNCSERLRLEGSNTFPRTCVKCKLGPCPFIVWKSNA